MSNREEIDLNEIRRKEKAFALYKTRLGYLKNGQLQMKEEKYAAATEAYLSYLSILGNFYEIPEAKLSPALFDVKKDLTELLLISHVYWDLAKIYDRTSGQEKRAQYCLDQFTKFTLGYKYQHINAQIVRKYLKKGKMHNQKIFEDVYKHIQINSKKCYIATHCFGDNHSMTNELRNFKTHISQYSLGLDFIDFYYNISPRLCQFLEARPRFNYYFTQYLMRPLLSISVKAMRKICF